MPQHHIIFEPQTSFFEMQATLKPKLRRFNCSSPPSFHLCVSVGKQFSLDSRMDLVCHGMDSGSRKTSNSAEENRAITEDNEEGWEGTKGRYCSVNQLN